MPRKPLLLPLVVSSLALAALAAPAALAQDPTQGGPEQQEAMRRWQEAMTPGTAHQLLERLVGDWDITVKLWSGPGDPQQSTGSSTARWVLGGRFVYEEFTSEMMGMPLTGRTYYGHDNMRHMYTMLEMDNLATAMQRAAGTVDETGTTIAFFGTVDDPTTGELGRTAKYMMRFESPNRRVFELHDLHMESGHTRVMEVVYTRQP